MEKEKNSTSEHKVLEPKKERKRRLVLSSDSEPEDHVASAGPKMDETASGDFGGVRSEEDDKSRAIEEIETDTDILYPKLSQEENEDTVLDPKSDNYASESGDVKLIEKKAESVSENIGKNKEVLSWNIDKYLGSMKHRDKDIHQGWNKEKALGFRYDKSRRMETGNAEFSRNKMKLDHARSHTEKTGGSNKSFNSMKHHMHRTLDKVRGDKEKNLRFISYKKRSTEFGDSEVSREKTKSEHLKSYAENTGESNRKLDFKKHRDTDIYQAWDNEKALGFRSDKKRSMETDDFEVSGMTRKPTHAEDLVEKVGRNNKMLDSRKYQDQDMHRALDKDKVLGFKYDQKRSTETGDVEISRKKAKSEHLENHVEKVGGINNKSNFIKHKDKSTTDGVLDFIGGLSGSDTVTKAKQIGVDKLLVQKLLVSSNESSRRVDEKSRHDEQSGPEEIANHLDNKASRIESKREENGGKSQQEYIRVQGKSGVLKILHHNKVSISRDDANARHEIERHSRKLSLPNTGKLSNSNDLTKRYGTEKSKFKIKLDKNARQVSAEGRSNRNGDKSKPDNSSALKGYKSLHLTQAKSSTDDGGESASGMRSSSPAKHAVNESIASRNEVKRKVREQIKTILLDAGWKIELRPRRGRDYEDAVYVSPQGTGYWSITKAYDVYRKQLNNASDDNKDAAKHEGRSSTSATIAPEVLILLKRNVVNRRKHKKEVVKLKHKGGKKRKKAKQTTKASCSEDKETSNVAGENRAKKRRNKSSALLDGSSAKKMRLLVRNQKKRCCTLLVRGYSQDEESEKSEYVPYIWKRTILSWMIDMGVLPAYGKVRYVNKSKNKTMLEGRVTRDGIHCSCCSKILTVPKFAIHAGSKLHQPYENTLVEASGISLLQCQINAWEKQEDHKRCGFYKINTDGDDPNDDTCTICADGGDLICCDGCPSTFHLNCLGLQTLPPGDWHCKNCSCKFCGMLHDPASCKSLPTLISCTLCEQKYHEGCAADEGAVSAAPSSSSNRFCGRNCQRVFRRLHKLIGVKNELEAGYYWSIIRRFDDLSKSPIKSTQRVESNSKIAVAHGVIDECFLPITDHRSGINLIDNVVYNCRSNFNRLNYSGFYTFILERSDEIICAASVRIHGTRFAEMPFIGTRNMYRRQGMCRRLFEGIESALSYFGTEMLVIPAISELTDTWTSVFGFKPLEVSLKEEIKCVNMLVFPGIGLLQKSLLKETTVQHSILRQVTKPKSEMIPHVFGGNKAETQKSVGEDQKISVNENETAPVHLGHVLQASHESNLFPSSLEQQTHDTGNQAIHQISVNTDKSVHSDHEPRNCCTSEAANFMRSNENTQFELETNANERNAINSLGVEGALNIFIASNSESEQISLSDKENKHDIQLIVVSDVKSSAVEHESTAKPQCVDDGNALEDSNERKLISCSSEQCAHEFNGSQASHQSFKNTEKSSHTDHKPKNYCTSQVTNYLNSNENNHSKLESNANDENATVSFGVERHLIICSDAKPEFELIAHAIDGNKPEIQQSQFLGFEGSAIEHEPATEHQLSDDRRVLEASHESNLFPCSLEQQACKFIGSQTSHQTSMSTDKSAHTENMSRNSCISEVVNSTSALSNAQYEVEVNVKENNPKISSGVEKLLNTCSNKNDLSASFGNREGSIVVDGMEATKLEKIELSQFQEKHHGTGDPFSSDESQYAHYFLTELQHCNDRPVLDASHGSNMLPSTSELIVSDFIEYQASHKIIGNADKSAHTDQKTKDCFTSDVSNNVRASKNGLASSLINGEVHEVVNGNEITDRHIFQEKTELHHLSVDLHGEGDAAARVEFLEKHVSMNAQPPYLTKHEDRQALEPSHESNLISYSPELNACEFIGNQASQQVSLNTDYSSQQVSMNTDNSILADYDSRNDCTSEVTNHMGANENIYIDTGSCYALNSVDSMRHIVAMHSVSCGLDDASDSINCLVGTNAASEASPKKSMVLSERADKNVSIGTCEAGIGICTDITNNFHEGSCDRIAEGDLGVAESVNVLNISSVSPVSKAVT